MASLLQKNKYKLQLQLNQTIMNSNLSHSTIEVISRVASSRYAAFSWIAFVKMTGASFSFAKTSVPPL